MHLEELYTLEGPLGALQCTPVCRGLALEPRDLNSHPRSNSNTLSSLASCWNSLLFPSLLCSGW